MKPTTKKTSKLHLNQETVRQLSEKTLDGVAGAAGIGGPKPLEFSGGPMCTGGLACTMAMGCSRGCA
jgi:hypothetical protein